MTLGMGFTEREAQKRRVSSLSFLSSETSCERQRAVHREGIVPDFRTLGTGPISSLSS